QQQFDDPVATTDSNAHNGDRKQILRKARRGMISRALAAGIIPGVVLFGLYGYLYAYHHGAGGETNCNEKESEADSLICAFVSIKVCIGVVTVFWLLVDVTIRSAIEWRRWNKWYYRENEIELGHAT
ncbi:hypothetical protein BGW41_004969, partial [Actinomortierella wolfii]